MPLLFSLLHLLLDMMLHEGGREIGVELGWPLAPRESFACFTLRIDCVLSQYYCVFLGPSLWFNEYVFNDGYLGYYVCMPTSLPRS